MASNVQLKWNNVIAMLEGRLPIGKSDLPDDIKKRN